MNSGSSVIRLQKILSQAGVASRRAAEKLIEEGRVSVNGRTVREMGVKADPLADVHNLAKRSGVMVRCRRLPEAELRDQRAAIAAAAREAR